SIALIPSRLVCFRPRILMSDSGESFDTVDDVDNLSDNRSIYEVGEDGVPRKIERDFLVNSETEDDAFGFEEYSHNATTVERQEVEEFIDQEYTPDQLGEIDEKCEKWLKHNKRWRRRYWGVIGAFIFFCAVVAITAFVLLREKNRILGMVFESRSEDLPLRLPEGTLQLRTYMLPLPTTKGKFTPFIASSQSPGRLDVVTNATHPTYNAYFVEHPGIQNVTMITSDFFCSNVTCFFLNDAHSDAFFETNDVVYRNFTYQLVEIPLPTGYRFISAQYCSFMNVDLELRCSILLEDTQRTQRFASISKNDPNPLIRIKTNTIREAVKAFHFSSKVNRIISWKDSRLAVFSPDQPQVVAFIEDVEADENVEILAVGDSVQIILVMKDEGDSTRVRVFAVKLNNEIIRRDELLINNRPSAITALINEVSFEICHLTRSHVQCYVNAI
ncbi:hypothetical protein PENTCL1PPCAC_288, partial [Pristionchus entomophagus]